MAAGGGETHARVVRQHITDGAGRLVLDEFSGVARHVERRVHHIQLPSAPGGLPWPPGRRQRCRAAPRALMYRPSRSPRAGIRRIAHAVSPQSPRMYGKGQQHTSSHERAASQWSCERDAARMPPEKASAGETIRGLRSITHEAAPHGERVMLVILLFSTGMLALPLLRRALSAGPSTTGFSRHRWPSLLPAGGECLAVRIGDISAALRPSVCLK